MDKKYGRGFGQKWTKNTGFSKQYVVNFFVLHFFPLKLYLRALNIKYYVYGDFQKKIFETSKNKKWTKNTDGQKIR